MPRCYSGVRCLATLAGMCGALVTARANAAIVTLVTPVGSVTGGQPVSAKATFSTSAGHVHVVLENLFPNPKSVTQCLTGLEFHIDTGESSGSLASSLGTERSIESNDNPFVEGGGISTGWALATASADLKLKLLGTKTAPTHTIIGPPDGSGLYSAANPSITGGSHLPFLGVMATFEIDVPGVTAASGISSAVFQFNTSAGFTVTGQQLVPEPATLWLLGIAALARRRRRRLVRITGA
ncbi:MAG: PEP-CTERM sorting domain-containing protein, partial [Tepidisphaeraceae bacterium]